MRIKYFFTRDHHKDMYTYKYGGGTVVYSAHMYSLLILHFFTEKKKKLVQTSFTTKLASKTRTFF